MISFTIAVSSSFCTYRYEELVAHAWRDLEIFIQAFFQTLLIKYVDASFIYNETFILTEVLNIGIHCVKSVHIRSFSGPCFPAWRLNTERYFSVFIRIRENTGKKNSKYGHFSRSDSCICSKKIMNVKSVRLACLPLFQDDDHSALLYHIKWKKVVKAFAIIILKS